MGEMCNDKCQIKPTGEGEVIETSITLFWFDKEGILYSIPKKIPRTFENMSQSLDILKQKLGNKKVCLISDSTYEPPYSPKARDYIKFKMAKMLKALAALTCTPVSKMVWRVMFDVEKPPYPVKRFDDVEKAKKWIRQYL
jgi:hypothetical protein